MFEIIISHAQDYQISFTGSGQSNTIDSIMVQNLTQDTYLTLGGNDVLHLVGTVGISDLYDNRNLNVYPNPMVESSIIEFSNSTTGRICIEIFNEQGVLIKNKNSKITNGKQRFEILNLNTGIYTVSVSAIDWKYTAKLISLGKNTGNTTIEHRCTNNESMFKKDLQVKKDLVQMQYNNGEIILFIGYASDYSRVTTLLPTQSQVVDFEFIPCVDGDGNNYSVVTIGTQTWMAENLNYETEESSWYNNSATNGDIYGRLYTWDAAMIACPSGWNLPNNEEWTILRSYCGGMNEAGRELKSTNGWNNNGNGTNSSGFSALPAGWWSTYSGSFSRIGELSNMWSSSDVGVPHYMHSWMLHDSNDMFIDAEYHRTRGQSVRCIKN